MKSVLGYMLLDGLLLAISFVTILHLYKQSGNQHEDEIKAGIILICFGFGAMAGGFLGGKLCDLITIKKTALLGTYLFIANCFLSIGVYSVDCFPLSGFVCFIWGFLLYYV